MTDDRDPLLQNLFAQPQQELESEAFVSSVRAQARSFRIRIVAACACLALALLAGVWSLAIPQELAMLVAQGLSLSLVDLGEGWLAWVLAPVNSVASLLVLSVKALRMGAARVRRATYAS